MEMLNSQLSSLPLKSAKNLSEILYGIDWGERLPVQFGDYDLRKGSAKSLFEFTEQNQSVVVGEETFPSYKESIERKIKYYEFCSDVFDFYLGDEIIGVVVGNPYDWCSYYLRYILIKKEHQGHNLQNQWVRFMVEQLSRYNVERIEVDFSPAHTAQLLHYQRMGFYFVGSTLSERWGSILRYVKFINPQRRDKYLDQFCHGVKTRA